MKEIDQNPHDRFPSYVISLSPDEIDYSLFHVHSDSRMSSVMPWDYIQFTTILKQILPDYNHDYRILDGTAHIGVESIVLAKTFPNSVLTSVELDSEVYNLLKQNIEEFGVPITAVNDDFTQFIEKTKENYDILYLDPPWGGRSYEENRRMMLYLSNIPVYQTIEKTLEESKARKVILKAPFNFDITEFKNNLSQTRKIQVFEVERKKRGFVKIAFLMISVE